ncbi:MAG: bifunctional phosphoglucose/phosphomannose isomerase [Thermoleophilaceae bacterium]
MSDLSRAAVEAADPDRMIDDVLAQPGQLADAVWRAESAGFTAANGGLVIAGMGGSAVGGDLAAAILPSARILTVRGYELGPWVGPDTLVLCASYSGDTEETLACFEAAGAAGARRAVVTTGGALGEAARAAGVPVMGVPAGFQPRAAVVYMTVAALAAAGAAGDEVERAAPLLARLAEEWGPDGADDSEAKRVAHELDGCVPVVVGAGRTVAPALRWKTQINENASRPAFWSELPEVDHNEICGYDRPLSLVLLDDDGLDERLRRRIDLTAASVDVGVVRVEARGETPFERVMSLVLLGDLVSVYMAVLAGEDPTPVPAIDRLKAELG